MYVESVLAILSACDIDVPSVILSQMPALPPYKTERVSFSTRQLIAAASKGQKTAELSSRILVALGNTAQNTGSLDNLLDMIKAFSGGKMKRIAKELAAEAIIHMTDRFETDKKA